MIRYPGSKDKIIRAITQRFPLSIAVGGLFRATHIEYREPFFGAGAIGFSVISGLDPAQSLWINDRDYGICCLWKSVLDNPKELCEKVQRFTPSTDAFYRFKEEDDLLDIDPTEKGFRKLALHQISFSGLGVKAGGPIGGRRQSSLYNVKCRWNAARLRDDIMKRHKALKRHASVRITSHDFASVIDGAPPHAFIYADPPYIEKGPDLYKVSMSEADHRRLAESLRRCRARWVLSYDDHPLARDLYSWARIEPVELTYTTAVAKDGRRRKNLEIIISPQEQAWSRSA